MSPVNSTRIGAFFVCLALVTIRGFAAYIPEDELTQDSSHVMKRAYMGLRLMCAMNPRNCPGGFVKRNFVQNLDSSYDSRDSVIKRLQDIIGWRHKVMRRRLEQSAHAQLWDVLGARPIARRK